MTDPVDTDALAEAWRAKCEHYAAIGITPSAHMSFFDGYEAASRAAADEVDRLRDRAVDDAKDRERLRVNFNTRSAEASRLRAVIENAPHAIDCGSGLRGQRQAPCTCWKADAL